LRLLGGQVSGHPARKGPCYPMGMFRKKPVVVEATQWFKNGDHPEDYATDEDGFENGKLVTFTGAERKARDWEGHVVRYFRRPEPEFGGEVKCPECAVRLHEHGFIDTLEGGHRVCPGDWIITGVAGERYPCKPHIFRETYSPVSEAGLSEERARAVLREYPDADLSAFDVDGDPDKLAAEEVAGALATIDAFETGRGANWRDSLDAEGRPTHGPERSKECGCQHCHGPLDAAEGTGMYVCPWCVARFPHAMARAPEKP